MLTNTKFPDGSLNKLKYEFSQIIYTDITMQIEFYDNSNNIVDTYRNTMIPQGFINTDWITLSFNAIDVTSMKVTQLIENQSVNTDGGPFTYDLLCDGQATYKFEDSEIDNCSTIGISCNPREVKSGGTLKRLFYVGDCTDKTLHNITVLDASKEQLLSYFGTYRNARYIVPRRASIIVALFTNDAILVSNSEESALLSAKKSLRFSFNNTLAKSNASSQAADVDSA